MKLIPPDEDGMAYLHLKGSVRWKATKQVEGQVIYDLDEHGVVRGIEFLFAPKNWLIKGETK